MSGVTIELAVSLPFYLDLITDYSHSLELVRLPPLSPLRGGRFPYFSDSPLIIRLFTTFGSGKLSVVFRWFVVTSLSALSAYCQAVNLWCLVGWRVWPLALSYLPQLAWCLADMTTLSAMSAHVNCLSERVLWSSAMSAYACSMSTQEIAQLIERTGLKKQEVAAAIGVSVATLRRWEHGESAMPDDKLNELRAIAGGKPALRSLGSQKPPTAVLATVPSTALIEELARRTRSGLLKDVGQSNLDARRSLRAVAFTDVQDD